MTTTETFAERPDRDALRVLLVEDDAVQRATAAKMLVSGFGDGVDVVAVGSVADARAVLDEHGGPRIDVVLCDHHLGDGTGLALARDVMADDPDGVVVLMTGSVTHELEDAAISSRLADFIDKSALTTDGLARVIRYALRRRDDARALRAERQRYRDLTRSLPDAGVLTCDQKLRILAVDGELYRSLGGNLAELAGRDLEQVLAPLGLTSHLALYARALQGEMVDHVQEWPDGRCYLVRFGPLRGEREDEVVGAMTVALDITAQHHAEIERALAQRALDEVRERFQVAFESAATGFVITSPEARLLQVNETFAAMLGLGCDELEGRLIAEITDPDDIAGNLDQISEALTGTNERRQFEKRFVHADGHSVPALVSSALVRDVHGEPWYFTAQVVDLTERKRAEEALRGALQRQRLVLANLPGTLIALYDAGLRVVEVEGLGEDSDGHTAESVRGAHLRDFLTPEGYAQLEPVALAALAGCPGAAEYSAVDGRHFAVDLAPFRQHDEITGVLTVWHDITGRRDHEDALRRHADQLTAMAEVVRAVGHSDPVDARHAVCRTALEVGIDVTSASVWEPLPDGRLQATTTHPPVARPPIATADDAVHGVLRTGAPLFVADVAGGSQLDASVGSAALVLPVGDGDVPRGVLVVGWSRAPEQISDEQMLIFGVLADEAAVAMQRADLHERLDELTRTDALTGLPNRRAWDELLDRELAAARRHGRPMSVAMLDLDHFKRYNDEHGHLAGDRLLCEAAAAWSQALRTGDVLARWGGEEFVILLPACTAADAAALMRRLRGLLPDQVTFSAGVAGCDGRISARELLEQADRALYRAKTDGRDRVVAG